MKILHSTPATDNYHMPAEFEPHSGCFIIWPERSDSWSYGGYAARKAFVRVAAAISHSEKVTVCASASQYATARQMLPDHVQVIELSTNDAWARDYAPTFVRRDHPDGTHSLRGIDWCFNAWGGLTDGLYFPWDKDNAVAKKLCDFLEVDVYNAQDFVMEGGAIHVDGEGTAMVTESCLLSPGRNPSMSKEDICSKLKEYLGVTKILWLPCGVFHDETNEHVDNICAFVSPGEVVLGWTDHDDIQNVMSKKCLDYLESETDAKGRPIKVHKLPMPEPLYVNKQDCEGLDNMNFAPTRVVGERLAASYVNFYIANGAIVMPGFGDPAKPADENHKQDLLAKEALARLFPDREIIQIYARDILIGGGNIHCITQQIPLI